MAEIEVSAMTDEIRRKRVRQLLPASTMGLGSGILERARKLVDLGLHAADAVHVAAAEACDADVLLTCDDRLLRRCHQIADKLNVTVANPLEWLKDQNDATNFG